MHPAEDERRAEATDARRRHIERHVGRGKRLQEVPQSHKLRIVDTTAGAAGVYQSAVWSVVCQQKCPRNGRKPSGSVQPTLPLGRSHSGTTKPAFQ